MKSRTYYYNIYKHYLKTFCEKCKTSNNLVIHHIDEDISNNLPRNLTTLCRKCHQIEHKCWENLPDNTGSKRIKPKKCIKCNKEFYHHHGYSIQKYCSQQCYLGFIPEIECKWCKCTFKRIKGHTKQLFCSRSCAMKNRNSIFS
jgi:hypothetical protein